MYFIRSIIFIAVWFFWTLIWGILCSPTLILPSGHFVFLMTGKLWSYITLLLLRLICGIKHKVHGKENIPNKPFIVASKHQSAWETIFFLCLFKNAVFIMKKELTNIPIYGWYLQKMFMIIIDRKNGMQALKQVKAGVKKAIEMGHTVIIFPEGTRTKPGNHIQYKSGIKFLHDAKIAPIVPIALNSGKHWINGSILKIPGTIHVKILNTINSNECFLEKLQHKIDSESENL